VLGLGGLEEPCSHIPVKSRFSCVCLVTWTWSQPWKRHCRTCFEMHNTFQLETYSRNVVPLK
jgi:hypothetical protein